MLGQVRNMLTKAARGPRRKRRAMEEVGLLLGSRLFDAQHYAQQVDTSFANEAEAAAHYLRYWSDRPVSTSAYFDSAWYLETYRDVAQSGGNPLLHYLAHGQAEGRLAFAYLRAPEIARIDALLEGGKPNEALAALGAVDRDEYFYDVGFRRAKLAFYRARYADCLQEVKCLLAAVPRHAHPAGCFDALATYAVEAYCASGRSPDAAIWLQEQYCHLPSWPSHAIGLLRRTIQSYDNLESFQQLLTPLIAQDTPRGMDALLHYSLAARDLGAHELALAAIKQRYIRGVSCVYVFGSEPESSSCYWRPAARTALLNLKEDLDAAEIPFFLISGTLLGYVREGDILSHDKDLDIGVMCDVSTERVQDALKESGRFQLLPAVNEKVARVRHANGVMADIFIHWRSDGKLFHQGSKTGWWNTEFTIATASFLGTAFGVPSDPELYLQENYGDWRTPVPDFDTFLQTPNMYCANKDQFIWYCYRTMTDYFRAGRFNQYAGLWRALCALELPDQETQYTYTTSSGTIQ